MRTTTIYIQGEIGLHLCISFTSKIVTFLLICNLTLNLRA